MIRRAGSRHVRTATSRRRSFDTSCRVLPVNRMHVFRVLQLRLLSSSSHLISETSSYGVADDSNLLVPGKVDETAESPIEDLHEGSQTEIEVDPVARERLDLVQKLSNDLKENISRLISLVDSQLNVLGDNDSKVDTQRRQPRLLSKRWETSWRKEQEKYHREKRKISDNVDINELWEEAILSAGIHLNTADAGVQFPDTSSTSSAHHEAIEEGQFESFESPLFGLSLDSDGRFPEAASMDEKSGGHEIDAVVVPQEQLNDQYLEASASFQQESGSMMTGILQALSLLICVRPNEWTALANQFQASPSDEESNVSLSYTSSMNSILDFVQHAEKNRYTLTTNESNLVLAGLLTSYGTLSDGDILGKSLEVFKVMESLDELGQQDGVPNSYTYRLLFAALPHRLMAAVEATKICQTIVKSDAELSYDTYVQAMTICRNYNDLKIAKELASKILDPSTSIRPSVLLCTLYLDLLGKFKLVNETMAFYREVRESGVLLHQDEDKLLAHISRWRNLSQKRDSSDSAILTFVLEALLEKLTAGESPSPISWLTVIHNLASTARSDLSLENEVARAFWTLLKNYPEAWPGPKLLSVGLRTAELMGDCALIAELIRREEGRAEFSQRRQDPISDADLSEQLFVPQQVYRKALQICLQNNDVEASNSILATLGRVEALLPAVVVTELKGLVLLCQANTGHGKHARELLFSMVHPNQTIEDSIVGAVLHSLAVSGQALDADELFESLKLGKEGFSLPGVATYNAMLLRHIHARNWDAALSLYGEMTEHEIAPNLQTIQGVLLASRRLGGIEMLLKFLDESSSVKMPTNEDTFKLVAKLLVPHLGTTTDEIRKAVREAGEAKQDLRQISLDLVRAARVAQMEAAKAATENSGNSAHWRHALSKLIEFYRRSEDSSATI